MVTSAACAGPAGGTDGPASTGIAPVTAPGPSIGSTVGSSTVERPAADVAAAARAAIEAPGITVHRVVVDGDRVAFHLEVAPDDANPTGRAAVELLEVGAAGDIADRVTISQPISPPDAAPSVNGHTMFDTVGAPSEGSNRDPDIEEAHRVLVRRLYAEAFVAGDEAVVDELVAPDYAQHNPLVPDGSAGLKALVANGLPVTVVDVLAEGDLVAAHVRYGDVAAVDIFRFAGGRIVEHWDVLDRP